MVRAIRLAGAALALAAALVLVACRASVRDSGTPAGGIAPTATVEATVATGVDLSALRLTLEPKWDGFDQPVYITGAHDGSGRLFVVEQGGKVKIIHGDGSVLGTPYLDIRDRVSTGGERGFLGLAFAPGFENNGRFYVDYTDTDGNTVIARYTASDPLSDSPSLSGPDVLLHIKQPYANHNGGCLQFGPDGMLWIGMGDGGSGGDPQHRAQNPRELLGKILRIDTEGASAPGKPYGIPVGQPVDGWAPELWAIGLRNPWRFSFDTKTGSLWVADVGQDAWEEVDVVDYSKPGLNFGWPLWEGDHTYPPGAKASRDGFVFPVHDYPHPTGESITGGYVYRGKKYPALVGTYVYGDFVKGWVAAVRLGGGAPQAETLLPDARVSPSSFGLDDDGELYLVDYSGRIWAVTGSAK